MRIRGDDKDENTPESLSIGAVIANHMIRENLGFVRTGSGGQAPSAMPWAPCSIHGVIVFCDEHTTPLCGAGSATVHSI